MTDKPEYIVKVYDSHFDPEDGEVIVRTPLGYHINPGGELYLTLDEALDACKDETTVQFGPEVAEEMRNRFGGRRG